MVNWNNKDNRIKNVEMSNVNKMNIFIIVVIKNKVRMKKDLKRWAKNFVVWNVYDKE